MKSLFILLAPVLFVVTACEMPPSSEDYPRRPSGYKARESDSASAGTYSMGGSSAANPPIKAGETSAAYQERLRRQQRDSLPEAQVLYQSSASDAFGRTTNTGVIQQSGGVTREVFIGNQSVYPGQPIYAPNQYNGTLQPGYVPAGTTAVYDPVTGRVIPVRRR
jgi:hypothetical protein